MGDPAGVGPEIIVKSFKSLERIDASFIIAADEKAIRRARDRFAPALSIRDISTVSSFSSLRKGALNVYNVTGSGQIQWEEGRVQASGGEISILCVRKAADWALKKHVSAIVTAPINKEAIHLAGYHWSGHTSMLGELSSTDKQVMLLDGGSLRVALATTHVAIRDLPAELTRDRVLRAIRAANGYCLAVDGSKGPVAVCGFNPHAGDGGVFGDEEARIIEPAIMQARKEKIDAHGPLAADTLYSQGVLDRYSATVAMYHDQGLVAVKMAGIDKTVNVTMGLPFVRTSVGHGTAMDIAWKGKASFKSLVAAVKSAVRLAKTS